MAVATVHSGIFSRGAQFLNDQMVHAENTTVRYTSKPYPFEQLLTKKEIKFFFSAFFFKPAKPIFSLQVHFSLGFIFLRFLELEMHLRGYFSMDQSDSRIQVYFKSVILLARNSSRLSLVDFFEEMTHHLS